MTSIADEILDSVSELNGQFAAEAVRDLNETNPLKTGLSRSNWTVSFDADTVVTFPINSPSDVVANVRTFSRGRDLTNTFYIRNNIEYIVPLAHGSSPQASRGWVDRSIVNAATVTYGVS